MPHDPFRLAQRLSDLVEGPLARRAVRLGAAGACGQAVTLYVSGCNLRCVHCWAGPELENPVARSPFLPHERLRARIELFRRENRLGASPGAIRISGGEPVLSERIFELLEPLLSLPGEVFIETNGVILGAHPEWCRRLARLRRVFLKVSLKAGTAEQYERLTGADRSGWEATWECVRALRAERARFDLNALSRAKELFSAAERRLLLSRLAAIHPGLARRLDEETLTSYPGTALRMRALAARGAARTARTW